MNPLYENPSEYEKWRKKNRYFHDEDARYLQFLVPKGLRVLDLGCSNGDILASLNPEIGVGVDLSGPMIKHAKKKHPHLKFYEANIEEDFPKALLKEQPFDIVILSDAIGDLKDIQKTFRNIHKLCTPHTRFIISYYSRYWEPILKLAEAFKMKMPTDEQNYLSTRDTKYHV